MPATMPATVTTGRAADSTQALGAAGAAGTAGTAGTAAGLDSSERKDPISPAPARVIASAPVGSSLKPAPAALVADTGRWDDAIATTWVNMRAAPNRGSVVVRTIDSGQRVSLGPPKAGWRSVRIGADRGWVDSRLFVVVPARRP